MVEFKDRLAEAMRRAGVKTQPLATALGISYQAVKKVLEGGSKSFSAINNNKAAKILGVSPDWLSSGEGDMQIHVTDDPAPEGGMAQSMSHLAMQTVPPIPWEQLAMYDMTKVKLPASFSVVMNDDSMAPDIKKGTRIFMSSVLPALFMPGEGVLIRDSVGIIRFRQLREARPGVWEARAFNDLHPTIDQERQGFEILAIKTAIEGRGI